MAIEKAIEAVAGEPDVEVTVVNPEAVAVETEDETIIIGAEEEVAGVPFGENLADHIGDSDLQNLSSELMGAVDTDRGSRKDWEQTYIRGLELLGLRIEERSTPWPGACGVFHPMLSEAVIRFQAQSIMETFPAKGPVKTQIVGNLTEDKEKQAIRVADEMNYQVTEVMTEYRSEHENMLFALPLAGSAFKKVYYDMDLERCASIFVPAEDMVVSYGASDLESCPCYTHIMKKTKNEVRKLQLSGFYRDIDLPDPTPDISKIQEEYDEMQGVDPSYEHDDRYTLYEIHVDLDLSGFEELDDSGEETGIGLPYVVTIDKSSSEVLSIYRNYLENDPLKKKMLHFVHYKYLPSLGFYGYGLIHCIGGLARSATSILRQHADAGTLSNLPGGLKSRGLRIKGDDSPIMPGEFRDVDVPGGAIKDSISFLPYKEPSQVLYTLLGNIVDEGRRFAAQADMKVSEMSNQAPVGTTLAIMEKGMKVMSAVQARVHASLKGEFRILANLIRKYMPAEYSYEVGDEGAVRANDFNEVVDIIPVSDPNATTMSQRIMQYQAAMQLASQAPQMYDMPELHRQMLEVMGMRDVEKIIPDKGDVKPTDPVTENQNLINSRPVEAFSYQDHKAHIAVHLAAIQDPKILELISQSPMAKTIQAAAEAHIREHLAFEYRKQIEEQMGVPLPAEGDPLPRDVEEELSRVVAQAAGKLLRKDQAEAQEELIQQRLQDPIYQQQEKELEIRELDVKRKAAADQLRAEVELEKAKIKQETEEERIASQEKTIGAQIGAKLAGTVIETEAKTEELDAKEKMEGARLGVEMAREILSKEKSNGD